MVAEEVADSQVKTSSRQEQNSGVEADEGPCSQVELANELQNPHEVRPVVEEKNAQTEKESLFVE